MVNIDHNEQYNENIGRSETCKFT